MMEMCSDNIFNEILNDELPLFDQSHLSLQEFELPVYDQPIPTQPEKFDIKPREFSASDPIFKKLVNYKRKLNNLRDVAENINKKQMEIKELHFDFARKIYRGFTARYHSQ
ncbi:hypothetical protein DICPUDRAFT_75231 [Dictyostelium purpureum]|uniref:Uncharacterized protein n=1 Tax=Dictyostelium purpureum TaxID=5786 RepID=F0ZA21_DICPU|nr:uncharacterized protein DICPUDRAFT_75231 [Dictyostelium purpureum]EGC39219.1 hypothetical protein DICPUDRAFT_75231 [Dictyostelium purpureum]|eukprot:XP_003284246.1 hypothetical protein DICPUDRAFT_75231 [Dictyostelium purpureum]